MKRAEYKRKLKSLNLTYEQRYDLLEILEELMKVKNLNIQDLYQNGVIDGVNKVYRFISGEGLAHDIFED